MTTIELLDLATETIESLMVGDALDQNKLCPEDRVKLDRAYSLLVEAQK